MCSQNKSSPDARVTFVKLTTTRNFVVQAFRGYFTKLIWKCKSSDLEQNIHEVNSHMRRLTAELSQNKTIVAGK